jgi:hypothetical protein
MATEQPQRIPLRERRPSVGAPLVDIQGGVSPSGISRPKHKRTFTGFGATEIKSVEGTQVYLCSIGMLIPSVLWIMMALFWMERVAVWRAYTDM